MDTYQIELHPNPEQLVQVPQQLAMDTRLTARARGLALYLMAAADKAGVYRGGTKSLRSANLGGPDSLRAALAELTEHGYLTRSQPHPGALTELTVNPRPEA